MGAHPLHCGRRRGVPGARLKLSLTSTCTEKEVVLQKNSRCQ